MYILHLSETLRHSKNKLLLFKDNNDDHFGVPILKFFMVMSDNWATFDNMNMMKSLLHVLIYTNKENLFLIKDGGIDQCFRLSLSKTVWSYHHYPDATSG